MTPEDIKAIAAAVLEQPMKVKRGDREIDLPVRQVLRETFQRAERVDYDRIAKLVAADLGGLVGGDVSIEAIEAAVRTGLVAGFREGFGD